MSCRDGKTKHKKRVKSSALKRATIIPLATSGFQTLTLNNPLFILGSGNLSSNETQWVMPLSGILTSLVMTYNIQPGTTALDGQNQIVTTVRVQSRCDLAPRDTCLKVTMTGNCPLVDSGREAIQVCKGDRISVQLRFQGPNSTTLNIQLGGGLAFVPDDCQTLPSRCPDNCLTGCSSCR
jgi:hypothetical protein